MTIPLQRLTASRLSAFRRCQRLHQLRYDLGWRAIADTAALRFGTHVHRSLEWWWRALLPAGADEAIAALHLQALELGIDPHQLVAHGGDALAPFEAALLALRTPALRDPLEQLTAEEMLFGYHLRWSGAELRPYDVELRFTAPLRDPDSGSTSRVWELAGKLDVMAYGQLEGREVGHLVVEHKCLAGDSMIFDHATGTYERVRDLCEKKVAPLVTALAEDGTLVVVQAKAPVPASVRPIVQVETLGGRRLRVSGNHPIWTQRGWVDADNLTIDDWIATPRQILGVITDAAISDEATRLIGYMIGDGCMSRMQFTKTDPAVLADVVRCAAAVGEEVTPRYPAAPRAPYIDFSQARVGRYGDVGPVLALMKQSRLLDKGSSDKRLPFHLALSDRQLGQLLGALWSTDGCIDVGGPTSTKVRIVYTSVSHGLCVDIQHALQRLGVVSNVRVTSVKYKGERRPVSTVMVVSRQGKRQFLTLAIDGVIPVVRSSVNAAEALKKIPTSLQRNDSTLQPTAIALGVASDLLWWDHVESLTAEPAEQTYDLEVPGPHTFVVDGVITHNTSTEDIAIGSRYWKRLRLNGQVSVYLDGARSLGYDPLACVYDVLGKPKLRPKEGEQLEAFRLRLRAAITGDLERYFVRAPITRLEAETEEHARDVWTYGKQIREGQRTGRNAPRNGDACTMYGSTCEFHSLCTGTALHRLEDDARFERLEDPHPELTITATDDF